MTHDASPLSLSLPELARALRAGEVSAREVCEAAIQRHGRDGDRLRAYRAWDPEGALALAHAADRMLADGDPPPLCGIPVSVKDLYGMEGFDTWAGTARALPAAWTRDAWLVARLREQGAVLMGKTHTVELAYGAVGINPHWDTPRNPWDDVVHRIPGGSSSGAGVSLAEGSALVALGTDTGGSIRIPASFTGCVGHKTTQGRWPVDGVVPLSSTLDTVGALTRSAVDSAYFFRAIESARLGHASRPRAGGPAGADTPSTARASGTGAGAADLRGLRVARPACAVWDDCQGDVADRLGRALGVLEREGASMRDVDGTVLDEAFELYVSGGIAAAECRAFLERALPEWIDLLAPHVGRRLEGAGSLTAVAYLTAQARRLELAASVRPLFDEADVLVLPGALRTPAPVADLADLDAYVDANTAALRATCPASILGLCAVSLPAGLDDAGMPVGLQLLAGGGDDDALLEAAVAVEETLRSSGVWPP